jgi:hypothetical protein
LNLNYTKINTLHTRMQNQERKTPKFKLVVCDLYNKSYCSPGKNIPILPFKHFLVLYSFSYAKYYDLLYFMKTFKRKVKNRLECYSARENIYNPVIRNYIHILKQKNYVQPHIAECVYLPSGECVAIIKTHWIRLIQRTWRRVLQKRSEIIYSFDNLRYREFTGRWRQRFPTLRGMLSYLTSSTR